MDDFGDYSSWESLKAKAIVEKGKLDRQAMNIGQLDAELRTCDQATLESKVSTVAALKSDIDEGLIEFSAVVDRLARVANSTAQRAQLNMYRTTFLDLQRDLHRAKAKLDDHFVRGRLFGNPAAGAAASDEEQGLLRERGHLDQTIGMTDEVISAAQANFNMLRDQGKRFEGMSGKVGQLTSMLPDVDGLIGKVGSEKRKESMVLGATIGVCIVFILWWKLLA
eukprot:GEMP01073292.1.p1 GENE.GEMP01073292.1~~GEMP01073292.1.p1  ORF type:complete len:223 (+),score=44.19 GEMP01073292.1:72-740(+)